MVYYGLVAIGKRMGVDPRTVKNWNRKLGFPLFVVPTMVLRDVDRYWTNDDAIKTWEYSLASARARAKGRSFDPALPCPLCGNLPKKEEPPTRGALFNPA